MGHLKKHLTRPTLFIFTIFLLFSSCRKFDYGITELPKQNQDYNELKNQFFNTSAADPEVQKLAADIRKQDSIAKFLPAFIAKNGMPKWDKVLYKVATAEQTVFNQRASANGRSQARSLVSEEEGSQGLFLVPLQSTTSNEIKSYITAYKHGDSLYTYRLYNKDSLDNCSATTPQSKSTMLNLQAVFGYFEKSINNNDSIQVKSPSNGTLKNVNIAFTTEQKQGTSNRSGSIVNSTSSTTCAITITVTIFYEWHDWTYSYQGSGQWVAVAAVVTIIVDCYDYYSSPDPTGGGGYNWWNYGTGWPWYPIGTIGPGNPIIGTDPGDPNWYPWWTGGPNYLYDGKTIFDVDTGDEDNNTQGGYDNTVYEDFDEETEIWPTIPNVIAPSDFVGWGTTGITRNCMSYAKAQIAKLGYKISDYHDQGQTFQIYTAAGGANLSEAKRGVSYLLYALKNGIPVIVGVDDQDGSPNPRTDNTTDHFVVIVGSGSDAGGSYFTFYDNASSEQSQGTNPNNKLYYNPTTGLIKGRSQTTYANGHRDYKVTMIRKSK